MASSHHKPVEGSAEDEPPFVGTTHPTEMDPAHRMAMLDGDDIAVALAHELVSDSLLCADASYVERRLTSYAARHVANQLFSLVHTCEPTLVQNGTVVFTPMELPSMHHGEEPRSCVIDATCRLEIQSKQPPPARPTPPSTPRKSKRLMVTTSLAASSLLANSPSGGSLSSPRSPFGKATGAAKMSTGSSGPVPGVPFSTAPPSGPTESPRKSVALLKSAMRLASGSANRSSAVASPVMDDEHIVDESDRSTDCDSDNMDAPYSRHVHRRSLKGAAVAPTATTLSSTAWSITLPGDPSVREDAAAPSASVDVEFTLLHKLPLVGRRASNAASTPTPETRRMSRDVAASPVSTVTDTLLQRRGTFLQLADERDAVEIDPMGMLGYEMREQLALSPGVKLQAETGELVKSGPQLPEMPTRMRRATFVDESLAHASPTRPAGRPSTTTGIPGETLSRSDDTALRGLYASNNNSGVFTLTECASATMQRGHAHHHHHSHNESTRSLAISHAGSVASSSSTTSVKSNLFRKPAKVVRPCTATAASSQCCGGGHATTGSGGAAPADNVAIAELVKQRAFQRKPSVLTFHSPPKKSQSRRSIVQTSSSAASRTLESRS